MKLAVISDVHSNIAGLQAVAEHVAAWQPDHVIVAGDVVNRGPCPAECLSFVQVQQAAHGWRTLLGNHEEYVIKHAAPGEVHDGPEFELRRGSYWTYCQLDQDVSELQAMPFSVSLCAPDGSEMRFTHASMRGTRDGIFRRTPEHQLREQIGAPLPPLFCVGHTHMPLIRRINGTLVVNAGSAGLPFDGNPQVSYAQVTWQHGHWEAEIIRLDYDRARAERDFVDSGFLDGGGPLASLVLIELQTAQSQLYQWTVRFEQRVLAGAITMEESVREFIRTTNGT